MENRLETDTPKISLRLSYRASYDLWLLLALAVVLPGLVLLPIPLLRIPLGLVAVLFAPGYAISAALFAHKTDFDGIARMAISIGISAAILPLIALLLDVLPWGIRVWPMTISLMVVLFVAIGVSFVRRARISYDEVARPVLEFHPRSWWRAQSRGTRLLTIGATVVICAVFAYGIALLTLPDSDAALTEFYVLGANGQAQDYPRETTTGKSMTVTLGITNRVGTAQRYRAEVRSGDKVLAKTDAVTLNDGATWQQPVQYALNTVGDDQVVDIILFVGDSATPYRILHLMVNVRQGFNQ